jgi:hypothetical protein
MFNLALALSVLTYSLSYGLHLPLGIIPHGIDVIPLAVLFGSFLLWLLILKVFFRPKTSINGWLPYALGLANAWCILTILVHSYNSIFMTMPSSVDEVLSPNPAWRLESLFRPLYPFFRSAVLLLGIYYGYKLYKSNPPANAA